MANSLDTPFTDNVMKPLGSPGKTVGQTNYDEYSDVGPISDTGGITGKIVTSYSVPTSGGNMVDNVPFTDAIMKKGK